VSLRVERGGEVLRITFDRPEKRNAVSIAMWTELEGVLADLDPQDGVLVLAGAGGVFSAGSDVSEFLDPACDIAAGIESTHRAVAAIAGLAIPSVAVVDGVAAGSALNLALACDFVVASEEATFSEIFARRGLSVDSGASWLVPRLVGQRRASELLLLGDVVDASTALEWGLISRVVPRAELADAAELLVDRLRAVPRPAMSGTRRLLAATWGHSLTEALDAEAANQLLVLTSPQTQELVGAFTTKRGASTMKKEGTAT
jgi:2-(1,2-epoxy-1,2-dihydrophenyl)acetyl-CoA isomerase